ncbi:Transposase IS4 [Popillia japonica]|uniref:Transposase IS4 n=1 Tax=Popillia japonica TaxID=7064 RepID=A0AAW1JCR1_POPJA
MLSTSQQDIQRQPLINRVNMVSQSLAIPLGASFSLDEAIEPYFGHHHMKQFIKGKPIRYGFKFWCLNSSEGYLLKFCPYCGAGDKNEGKTLGTRVTEKFCLNYFPQRST